MDISRAERRRNWISNSRARSQTSISFNSEHGIRARLTDGQAVGAQNSHERRMSEVVQRTQRPTCGQRHDTLEKDQWLTGSRGYICMSLDWASQQGEMFFDGEDDESPKKWFVDSSTTHHVCGDITSFSNIEVPKK